MRGISDSITIAARDIIRSFRQKSHLLTSVVRPVIWLFLLGNGLRGSFQAPEGFNYIQYIFPGMLAMNILFASIMSGTSIIWDREFGFLKEVMVAPVSRLSIVFGKTLSGSITAAIEGTIVLILFPLVGLKLSVGQILLTLAAMFLVALAMTSIGILIAAKMTSIEGFGTINNFIIMPMFFLSGAMYPIERVPEWLRPVIMVNPMTYSVDLLRGIVLNIRANILLDIAVISAFGAVILAMATLIFIHERK